MWVALNTQCHAVVSNEPKKIYPEPKTQLASFGSMFIDPGAHTTTGVGLHTVHLHPCLLRFVPLGFGFQIPGLRATFHGLGIQTRGIKPGAHKENLLDP